MAVFEHILIATDFSRHAEAAQALGTRLAKELGARVHLAHAFDLPLLGIAPYQVTVPDPEIAAWYKAASEKLEAAAAKVRAEGVPVTPCMLEVPAAAAIVAEAEAQGCDLIVMGTRGGCGLPHVLLGSQVERTLRTASCPVLTVKADDA